MVESGRPGSANEKREAKWVVKDITKNEMREMQKEERRQAQERERIFGEHEKSSERSRSASRKAKYER